MTAVPKLRGRVLDEKLTVPMEGDLKKELMAYKHEKDVDVLEWIRMIIRREMPNLRKAVS